MALLPVLALRLPGLSLAPALLRPLPAEGRSGVLVVPRVNTPSCNNASPERYLMLQCLKAKNS